MKSVLPVSGFLIYAGIFLGIFLEGEMVMLSAVISARNGSLNIFWIIFIGAAATYLSDCFYFFLGRTKGTQWFNKSASRRQKIILVHERLKKYPILVYGSYRFLYGLRSIVPFVIGTGSIKTRHFLLLVAITTSAWSLIYVGLGYLFGRAIEVTFGYVKDVEKYVFSVLVGGALLFLIYKKITSIRAEKERNIAE